MGSEKLLITLSSDIYFTLFKYGIVICVIETHINVWNLCSVLFVVTSSNLVTEDMQRN
jgi:hypothetical protein